MFHLGKITFGPNYSRNSGTTCASQLTPTQGRLSLGNRRRGSLQPPPGGGSRSSHPSLGQSPPRSPTPDQDVQVLTLLLQGGLFLAQLLLQLLVVVKQRLVAPVVLQGLGREEGVRQRCPRTGPRASEGAPPLPQAGPRRAHLHDRVHLPLQQPDLGHVLPDGLLQVEDAAALLLGVAGDLQLETDPLLLLAVLLRGARKEEEEEEKTGLGARESQYPPLVSF